MRENQFKTPILFVVFNRPDTASIVFEEIRKLRPTKLYVAADGPRPNRPADIEGCRLTREVVTHVDWPCEVKTLFQEKNLGCKYGVYTAFDWFFKHEEEGIILEDDDLPDPSFFPFCQELLEKYRTDERVMHISGNNFLPKNKNYTGTDSYYFSRISHIWGWATWRRAWKHYDVELTSWPTVKESRLLNRIFSNNAVTFMWGKYFQKYYERRVNSYDGQWVYACLVNGGFCINPSVNLVSNIGFGNNATHTTADARDDFANLPTEPIIFPLSHPEKIQVNSAADDFTLKYLFNINRYWSQKVKWFLKSNFTKPYMFLKKQYYKKILGKDVYDDTHLVPYLK
jgi:hypothetical protein